MLSTNARGMLRYEHSRHKAGSVEAVEGGQEELQEAEEESDLWEESYGGHQDSKPNGPTAVAMDFTFAGMNDH
jgi:alpha 1,3-glucosidase